MKKRTRELDPRIESGQAPITVLLIEDNPGDARLIQEMLKSVGNVNLRIEHAATLTEGLKYVGDPEKSLDAVLLDLGLPDSQGFETFEKFQKESESFTTIILSGLNDVDLALHAVRQGAQDYLVKGQISGDVLLRSIRHAIQRDESERLLRESQERYQNLVDMMPDAIVVHSNGKVVFANPAAIRLVNGKESGDVLGKKVMDFVHPDYRDIVVERIKSAQTQGVLIPAMEEKFIRLDGTIVDVEVVGTLITFEDNPATQLIIRDITERKQREREMEAVAGISRNLRSLMKSEETLPVILDQALATFETTEGTITLEDTESLDHVVVVARGQRAETVGMRIPKGTGVTSQVMKSAKPYLNNHFRTNPDPKMVKLGEVEPTEAVMIIPITAEKQIIGTMAIGRETPFEGRDIKVLSAICDIGGAAIHRANLFEQTERRLRHLRSLREIDTAIASSLDLDLTLDVIISQTVSELRVDAGSVLLLDEQQVLRYAAGRGFHSSDIKKASLKFGEGLAGMAVKQRTIVEAPVISDKSPQYSQSALFQPEGFVSYYGAPLIVKGKVIGVLETFHRSLVKRDKEWVEFLQTLAGQAAIAIDNASLFQDLQRSNQELRHAYDRTIEGWAHALSLRDMETIDHSRRVSEMTLKLARALRVSDERLVHVRRGALLHDIGKMSIPDRVLGKTGPLNEEEWAIMRQHPEYARQMLSTIEFLHPAMPIPTAHHEKWDGSGYPNGLKENEIPLEARIFAVVDVWDALRSDRPYRSAWPEDKVRDYIRQQSGKHFDPHIVDAFFQHVV
jgi:PAS domain S-box-containing protein/putative nucleotidyltransferase with HDIG domain